LIHKPQAQRSLCNSSTPANSKADTALARSPEQKIPAHKKAPQCGAFY
jgi:hypothetical protein